MTKTRRRIREIHRGEPDFPGSKGLVSDDKAAVKRTGGYGDEETGRICGEYT